MSIEDDLATLRDWITDTSYAKPGQLEHAALSRVEAEIARLEQDNAVLRELPSRAEIARLTTERDQWQMHNTEAYERAEAAEAEVARLRDGLRRIGYEMPTEERNPDGEEQAAYSMQLYARALLADQDGEDRRCSAINPRSTERDQCQRPRGHEGAHMGVSHSGTVKIYPSKWADQDGAATCCCPAGSYNPGSVHEDYCPLGGAA